MYITSPNNEHIKYLQKLKQKKYREEEKRFLIEDEHLINEALKKGCVEEIIAINEYSSFDNVTYVNEKIMKMLSSQVTGAKIIAVCHFFKEKIDYEQNIIVLDNIQDPGNLGTIIRSAVAFNFKNIVLSPDTVSIYNEKAIRASEGMLFHVNFLKTALIPFLKNLDASYLKVTTNVTNGKDIKELKGNKYALVIGNEGHGVTEVVSELCDEFVYIKMNKNCESLNAGVAASILMYEVNHG